MPTGSIGATSTRVLDYHASRSDCSRRVGDQFWLEGRVPSRLGRDFADTGSLSGEYQGLLEHIAHLQ